MGAKYGQYHIVLCHIYYNVHILMKFFTLSSKWQIDIMNFNLLQLKHKKGENISVSLYERLNYTENKILYYIWLCMVEVATAKSNIAQNVVLF